MAILLPSGDTRGYSYGPGGSLSALAAPSRSSTVTSCCAVEIEAGPGMYASDPPSETVYTACAPANGPNPRTTPSTTRTGEPVVWSRFASKGTAYNTPLTAYTMWPVGT